MGSFASSVDEGSYGIELWGKPVDGGGALRLANSGNLPVRIRVQDQTVIVDGRRDIELTIRTDHPEVKFWATLTALVDGTGGGVNFAGKFILPAGGPPTCCPAAAT